MRVALIGGAGFIGHNLALNLSKAGHSVFVIDNLMWNNLSHNVTGEQNEFKRRLYQGFLMERFDLMRNAGVTMINRDARLDMSDLLDSLMLTDIVHLTAISSAVEARKRPGLCFDLQLITLRNVLEFAKGKGIRVTFMSSSTVYGDFEEDSVDEDTRPQPKGIYANTKYMGERLVRTYHEQYDMDTIIIRPSALYGERCVSGRVSQKFIEYALEGIPLPLEGGGSGKLDFTHIGDLVEGIKLALERAPPGSNTYNLTFGHARSIKELALIVGKVVPCSFSSLPRDVTKPIRGTLLGNRARDELGFTPVRDLETGYLAYCNWYKRHWDAGKAHHSNIDFEPRTLNQNKTVLPRL